MLSLVSLVCLGALVLAFGFCFFFLLEFFVWFGGWLFGGGEFGRVGVFLKGKLSCTLLQDPVRVVVIL